MLAALLLVILASNESTSKPSELSLLQLVARLPEPADYPLIRYDLPPDPRREYVLEFESRMGRGELLGPEEWKCLLLDRHWLRWRQRWPRAEPFAVGFLQPPFCRQTLRLGPRVPGWKSAWSYPVFGCESPMHQAWAADYQVLGMLPQAENTIVFDLVPYSNPHDAGSLVNGLGTIELHIRAMDSAEDCLTPLADSERSAEIEKELAANLFCSSRGGSNTPSEYRLRLFERFQPPADVGVGLEAVLLHKGTPERRSWMVVRHDGWPYFWEDGGPWTANFIHMRFDPLTEAERQVLGRWIEPSLDRVRAEGNKLFLRGSALRALRNWDATYYWAGEIEVPLADLIRR